MKVLMRNPKRELDVAGPVRVDRLLADLDVNPESVIVIRGSELVTKDTELSDTDVVELRPVISGGSS